MARIYCDDEIDAGLRKRLSAHRAGIDLADTRLLAVYDRSIFGRVKAGIAFGESKLIVFDEEAQEIAYDTVQQAQWQISEQWGLVTLILHLSSGESWTHDLGLSSDELNRLVEILAQWLPFADETHSATSTHPLVVKASMPISTTSSLGRQQISAFHGPVFGQAEVSLNRQGVPKASREQLAAARQRALEEMEQSAEAIGGQAVVGLVVDHISLDSSCLLVTAVGTAVSLVKHEGPYR